MDTLNPRLNSLFLLTVMTKWFDVVPGTFWEGSVTIFGCHGNTDYCEEYVTQP